VPEFRTSDAPFTFTALRTRTKLPRRALGLVLDWAELHRQELRDNWVRGQEHDALSPIAPLE
jgi:hypothetical protein